MTYKERLCCWAIARLLPSEQWIIVARFRSRSDADGHFKFLRQTIPHVKFEVVFDLSGDSQRLSALADRPSNLLTSGLYQFRLHRNDILKKCKERNEDKSCLNASS